LTRPTPKGCSLELVLGLIGPRFVLRVSKAVGEPSRIAKRGHSQEMAKQSTVDHLLRKLSAV